MMMTMMMNVLLHNLLPHRASVKVAQCNSTASVLVPFQGSFAVDAAWTLFHQNGSDKNLQSCLVDPSGTLL